MILLLSPEAWRLPWETRERGSGRWGRVAGGHGGSGSSGVYEDPKLLWGKASWEIESSGSQ